MPDDFGPIYEGLIAAAAERIGIPLLPAGRQSPQCRDVCAFASACAVTSAPVELDVDPDLILEGPKSGIVVYVTHWRTADSFQKKFWRTMEELFQYRLYRPDFLHINWVFEPLQIKGGLLSLMKQAFDWSEDYNSGGTLRLDEFMEELPELAKQLAPASPEKAKDYFLSRQCTTASRIVVKDVQKRLSKVLRATPIRKTALWDTMVANCLKARQRSWSPLDINCKIRTPVQIGAILEAAARHWKVKNQHHSRA